MVSIPLRIDELRKIIIEKTKKLDKDAYMNKCTSMNEMYQPAYKLTEESKKAKAESDTLLKEKNLNFAKLYQILDLLNKSIAFAPNDSKELAMAYADKSSVLFRIRKYKECIGEIDKAMKITDSINLKISLLVRKAKCHTALGSSENKICLEKAKFIIARFGGSKVETFMLQELIEETESVIKENKIDLPQEEIRKTQALKMIEEVEKADVWKSIEVRHSNKYGRHLVAARDFKPGEIISVEKPYFNNLEDSKANQYCAHCFNHLWTAVPCNQCVRHLYCSEECRIRSWNEYHKLECPLQSNMRVTFESEGCDCLAFFVMGVFCKALRQAGSIEQLLADSESPNQYKGDTSEGVPLNKDFTNYKSLFTLPVSQPDKRTLKWSVRDTIAQLIGFAKFTNILGKKYDFTEIKKLLKDDTAILVGALLLKLNLILHDSNLWVDLVDPNNRLESSDDEEAMEETIMKRLNRSLPLLALHTVRGCIPNVESYATHGNKFITCAIRPIKAGEELILNVKSESVWYKGSTSERQLSYSKMYRCPCNCQACTGNWSEVVSNTYEFMMRAIKEMESPETTKIAKDFVSIVTHWEANCLKSNFPDFEVVSKAMNLVSVVWEHEKLPMPSPTIHKSVILLIEIMGIFYDPSEIYAKLPQLRPSLIDVKSKAELRLSKKL